MLKFAIAALLGATSCYGLRVGVVSDFHTMLAYDSQVSDADDCKPGGAKASEIAPIGRINCDPSPTLVDFMLQRFNQAFGSVDVILVTGDHVGHGISPHLGSETPAAFELVKENLQASADLVKKNFPDTLVLTNVGNNDGYHSQAPKTSQAADYYEFLHNLWFADLNTPTAAVGATIKDTFMQGGYYRVDVSDTISVLTFNNEYMDIDDDISVHADIATVQLNWLEEQLIMSKGRKFILSGHVYAGTRYHAEQLWHPEFAERYFQILRDHASSITLEVAGHDHYADLRYHSSFGVLNLPDTPAKFDFHNLLVAPGITPNKGNNPGVAVFEVSEDGEATNLEFEFIDLVPAVGKSSVTYADLKFNSLKMKDYGVTSISADALTAFRKALEADQAMTLEYLTRKMGFDANSAEETQMAMDLYAKKDLITTSKHKTGEFICSMHKSLSPEEFNACCASANKQVELFLQ